MSRKPGVQSDSFLGDFINAVTMRPIYRLPVETPADKQEAPPQPAAEPAPVTVQQEVQGEFVPVAKQEAQEKSVPTSTPTLAPAQDDYMAAGEGVPLEEERPPLLVRVALGIHAFMDVVKGKPTQEQPAREVRETPTPDNTSSLSPKPISKLTYPNAPVVRMFPGGNKAGYQHKFRGRLSSRRLIKAGIAKREAKILEGLSHGQSPLIVARRLRLEVFEVENTIKRMMKEAGVSNRNDLIRHVYNQHPPIFPFHPLQASKLLKTTVSGSESTTATRIDPGFKINLEHSPIPTLKRDDIPKGHPEHPSNDLRGKGTKGKGKQDPAHSTDTSSTREHPQP